ncbi:MAG: sugar phosphate nucleotidyltransferase [Paenibacillaceae bacterium]
MDGSACMAMLLAGGEGRRLSPLTDNLAKPAVLFGMEYRIIDFPLSNCANSGLNRIGVLTQYQSETLHDHIGDGKPWGLHTENDAQITLLSSDNMELEEYSGTANAIYQNIDFIDQHHPEHVLIVSADHIYQMDYRKLLAFHQAKGASATISVVQVPSSDISQFGIIKVDSDHKIMDFTEKPKQSSSNLASMGIYMFRWSYLRKHLLLDAHNHHSSHDFGKDIIPQMLEMDKDIYTYLFSGYWRDVGTIDSLWNAHMDWLDGKVFGNIDQTSWPIMSRIASKGVVSSHYPQQLSNHQSFLHPDSSIHQYLSRSIICSGVEVGKNSIIRDSVIMPNVTIGRNVRIHRAIIGEGAVIKNDTVIGGHQDKITVIAPNSVISGGQQPYFNVALS